MRPRSLDEFIGQEHIVGPGCLLRRAIQKDQLSSIILAGPPGTGKTTLARVIANSSAARFVALNAVLAGVADIRSAIEEARRHRELYGRRTILFVDEVHRWNKAQQDALLPWVENGIFVLIGATTENPFFEVNRALVSRSRVFQLRALDQAALTRIAQAAIRDPLRGYGSYEIAFEEGALEFLVSTADGDARNLLNALELAIETSGESWPPAEGARLLVSRAAAEESIQRRAVLYDKDGDYHYDAASAFIKSLRGSDPDAALYWLARMVYAGEDPRFIFRRMLISACEDVGLADPQALSFVLSAAQAFDRLGLPEGQFPLAEAALYLATAPKSNSTLGFFDALKSVEAESAEVPDHLKDGNRDAKAMGHGEAYMYPHAYKDHWVAQQYLPDSLRGTIFYQPGALGFEDSLKSRVLERREAQVAAIYEAESGSSRRAPESGVWSAEGEATSSWKARAEGSAPARLAAARKALFERAGLGRADRILIPEAREGYLVWEALRRSPEGTVAAIAANQGDAGLIDQYASTLPEVQRPLVSPIGLEALIAEKIPALERAFGFSRFDAALCRDLLVGKTDPAALLEGLGQALPGTRILCVESLPREGARLSSILPPQALGDDLVTKLAAFEEKFYAREDLAGLGLPRETTLGMLGAARLEGLSAETLRLSYPRRISAQEFKTWLAPASPYGAALAAEFSAEELDRIMTAAQIVGRLGPLDWPMPLLFFSARFPD